MKAIHYVQFVLDPPKVVCEKYFTTDVNYTYNKKNVTCKLCLKWIKKVTGGIRWIESNKQKC